MSGLARPTQFVIRTFNKISKPGLARFDPNTYSIKTKSDTAHAILIRSHSITDADVPLECRALARCGAGTNNCNTKRMTELGIPVFNTPGANANAVKELVLCSMLLASRGIVEGINHMEQLHKDGTAHERIEKDKAMFGGRELVGKTLGLIGLGAIGAAVANAALALGMKVVGHDPSLSVEGALRLPGTEMKMLSIDAVAAQADYISLHTPYNEHTKGLIGKSLLAQMKKDASILNFSRGEIVDENALADHYEAGATGRYICDFALSERLWSKANVLSIPHLGASTEEAEENAASMAVDTIRDFLETGEIYHSVNFPTTKLPQRPDTVNRCCIVTANVPGMLGRLMTVFGDANINVVQQINASRGDIAYNVIDLELSRQADGSVAVSEKFSVDEIQRHIMALEGVKSSRFINDWCPGSGYAIKHNGEVIGIGIHKPTQRSYAEI
ncbi:hypothetical protein M885DRAFT_446404 [Pelagophyceae sp. CCMP2097]|nr:hypothetical protein M885DRAFT_446404 [Pelagophyceae sp. CCMP2097]